MEEEKMGRAGSSSSECRVEETKQNEMRIKRIKGN